MILFLFRFVFVVALLGLGACTSAPRIPSEDWRTISQTPEMNEPIDPEHFDPDRVSRAIFEETNIVRRGLNLPPFQRLDRLDDAADIQASSNALGAMASHRNVITAWATPSERVRSVGLVPRLVSENVAVIPLYDIDAEHGYYERSTDSAHVIVDGITGQPVSPHSYVSFGRAIVQAWMNSPGHRANIVNPTYKYLGCSARPTRSVSRFQMLSATQVFFTPFGE